MILRIQGMCHRGPILKSQFIVDWGTRKARNSERGGTLWGSWKEADATGDRMRLFGLKLFRKAFFGRYSRSEAGTAPARIASESFLWGSAPMIFSETLQSSGVESRAALFFSSVTRARLSVMT